MSQRFSDTPRDPSCPHASIASHSDTEERSAALNVYRQRPVINSEQIFQGQREVLIWHNSELYRLIMTRNNKLILQK